MPKRPDKNTPITADFLAEELEKLCRLKEEYESAKRECVGGNKSSIGYFVTWGDAPTITLHYRWRDSEDVRIPVHLQTTPTQFGGERWWFTCPLIVGGVACNRRAGKLHLPPGARYFGCRKCHDLTYRSCQEAHQEERLFGRIERMERYMETLTKRGA